MNEKDTGHEHTGLGMELKLLLREPPLLISIAAVFLLFGVFIIYPFVKILLVPTEQTGSGPLQAENSYWYLGIPFFLPLSPQRQPLYVAFSLPMALTTPICPANVFFR